MCSFVATPAEFRKQGCPNCEDKLEMRGDQDQVMNCTTAQFDGVIAMIRPEESWVAKWQRNGEGWILRPRGATALSQVFVSLPVFR